MREWVINNTGITAEEYDKIMCFQDKPEDSLEILDTDPKKLILRGLEKFSLKPVNFWRIKKFHIIKDNDWYVFFKVSFKIMADYIKDNKLYSKKRYGECYNSYFIALENKLDIVLALIKGEQNFKCMHAFLVGKLDGVEVVYDYTLNLILKKEDYYDLMDVEEISYFTYQDLQVLDDIIGKSDEINSFIYIHELLCFPKEIAKALTLERKKE